MSEDRYSRMDRDALLDAARRMDKELTYVWQWYDRLADWVEVNITCPYCKAGPGQECIVLSTGEPAARRHGARWTAMQVIRGDWDG